MKACECGCGTLVKNRFVSGHNSRVDNPMNYQEHRDTVSKNASGHKFNGEPCPKCFKIHKNTSGIYCNMNRPEVRKKVAEKLTGRPLTKEHCEKVSKTLKQKYKSGLIHVWSEGLTRETCDKLKGTGFQKGHPCYMTKEDYLKRKVLKGSDNPAWCGGTSYGEYGQEFNEQLKKKIRERDGYRCQECFRFKDELKDKRIYVHHIDFDKKNNSSGNLISLCGSCHSKTQFNRNHWIEYYQGRMKESGRIL